MTHIVNEIEITVKVKDQATAELAAIAAKARAATQNSSGSSGIKVPIEADTQHFEASVHEAMDDAGRIAAEGGADMSRAFGDAESGAHGLEDALDGVESASHGAGDAASDAGSKASSSGAGFSFAALKMTGMITAALALAPALAALPAAGAAISVGLGTMSLGLGGVITALKDYGQQSTASGVSGAQMAQTAFSNAVAIRNAEQAITDAKKQAAQAAQSSADQIYSAQERVEQSAYSLKQAEQSLADAEKSATDAQKALTQARQDAANQLVDLNNAAANSNIAVQQAELNLTEAREKLTQVNGNARSTDNDRRQAQIDLLAATQNLKNAQQQQIESQQAADAANKTGVDGMQQVVSAQDAVQKANEGVASAQHGVAEATQAQADAQKALARAVQAAADQQAASAEAVQKAVQNLADTYEQQRLAAAAAASSGSAAADKFAQDMAKLTPAGQAFVNQVLSMKGGLDQLKATAQTSMLPGFTSMLQNSGPMLPIFNQAIKDMGGIIGDTAKQFGLLMQSPAFQGQLTQVLKDGAGLAKSFSDGMVGLVSGVMQAASGAGPIVEGIGNGIKLLMTSGIPDFLNNLVSGATQIGQGFQSALTIISNLGGPLGTVASAVAVTLAPALQVLATPAVQQSLQSIATSIGQILIALSPVVTMFAQGLAGALRIVAPLLQSVAKFVQDNQSWFVPLAKAITIATIAVWAFNAALAVNPVILLAEAIAGLVVGLIYAWEHFKGFRDFMKGIWGAIKTGFDFFLGFVQDWWPELLAPFTGGVSLIIGHWNDVKKFFTVDIPRFFNGLLKFVTNWWPDLIAPFTGGISSIIKHWGSIEDFFAKAPGRLASAGAHMWDWIWTAFKGPINSIIRAWDSLHFTMPSFDTHIPGIGKIGGFDIGVWQIPTFAVGGVLPGGLTAAIGERGWEPLRLPDGTVVIPHANARQALADGAMGGGGATQVVLSWEGGGGDEFFAWLRKGIRARAGNGTNSVQRALGQTV